MTRFTLHAWSHKSNWHSLLTDKWLFLLKWFVFQFPIIHSFSSPCSLSYAFLHHYPQLKVSLHIVINNNTWHQIKFHSFLPAALYACTPRHPVPLLCLLIQWSRFLSSYKRPCPPWMLFQLCSVCASLAISPSLLEHGHENIYLLRYLPSHKAKLPLSPDPTQILTSLSLQTTFQKRSILVPPLPTTC